MKYDFNVIIKKTNRIKTVSFLIKNQSLILSVPKYISSNEIDSIIESKIHWIKKKLINEKENNLQNKRLYSEGEIFLYLGQEFILKIKKNEIPNIVLKENNLLLDIIEPENLPKIKEYIREWYKNKSINKLNIVHKYYESLIGLKVNKIKFGEYKSKWGSCNSNKVISYDWRIIMAPNSVINYLVVHEISHLLHPNHSQYFWQHVEKFIKDYRDQRKWLKNNSNKLVL